MRGLSLPATVYADLSLAGDTLTVTPAEVELPGLGLRVPASRLPAGAARARSIPLPALPGGLAYRSVGATGDGLRVVAGGTGLRLSKTGTGNNTCGGTGE